ncbi:MAG: aldehyde dehydrogenase family protein [Myxococcota bacterium]
MLMTEEQHPPTTTDDLDRVVSELAEQKTTWMQSTLDERIQLLESLRVNTARLAEGWVDLAIKAKQLPEDSPLVGEEWTSGPWALLEGIQHLKGTLETLKAGGDPMQGATLRARADGQVIARVHPANRWEQLLINGVEAEVWMDPSVHLANVRDHMAAHYKTRPQDRGAGKVALVLGAGNIASIPPLDMLYKLFIEGQVVIVKMNPVNDYLGPIFEQIFQPFIAKGYVRFAYGGVPVGQHLTDHALVDEIHVTGSERTYDAIVFGVGEAGATRKANDDPRNPRRVTAELGGVSPVIVVPGPWSAEDLTFQAENVATQKMHNGGFNCIASQVLVLPASWSQRSAFLTALEAAFAAAPSRAPYYPGAADRIHALRERHPEARSLDTGKEAADADRVFVPDVDAAADDYVFHTEVFAGALAQTTLPGADAATFLRNAVTFANETLHGTLGMTILIHPKTIAALGPLFEDLIAALRYGTIGINAWSGVGFLLPRVTWGAFPGHPRHDIQSGAGVVHNALMFDKPQKSVIRAPFRPFPRSVLNGEWTILPKPPWFVTNKQSAEVGRLLTMFAAEPSVTKLPAIFAAALQG